MFGKRLKLARKQAGLSLRELANAMDNAISAQAIGKYERGDMMPSSKSLLKLSHVLTTPINYLMSPTSITLKSVEFHTGHKLKASEKHRIEAVVLDKVNKYLQIEKILNLKSTLWNQPKGAPYSIKDAKDIDKATESVRNAWKIGNNSIRDLTELLEEQGLKVIKTDFSLSVPGLACQVKQVEGTDVPVIVIDSEGTTDGQRFTLAHEMGRLLLHIDRHLNAGKKYDQFARSFLIPKDLFVEEVGCKRCDITYAEIEGLNRSYGVSAETIIDRLGDLDVISPALRKKILYSMDKQWTLKEPSPIEWKIEPNRFKRLCFRALSEDYISLAKASELLNMKVSDIETECEETGMLNAYTSE